MPPAVDVVPLLLVFSSVLASPVVVAACAVVVAACGVVVACGGVVVAACGVVVAWRTVGTAEESIHLDDCARVKSPDVHIGNSLESVENVAVVAEHDQERSCHYL